MRSLPLLSYLANGAAAVVIGYLCWRSPNPAPLPSGLATASRAHGSALRDDSKSSEPAITVNVVGAPNWATTNSRAVIVELKKLGAPPEVLADVVRTLLMRKYNDLRNSILFPPGTPAWMRHTPQLTPEKRERLASLGKGLEDEMRELLGSDFDKTTLDKQQLAIMPNGLADDKRAKVADIATDYQAARRSAGLGMSRETQEKINGQMVGDLQQVLSPDELHEYMAYNSQEGMALQQRMAGTNIDDHTYVTLYDALQEYKKSHPSTVGGPGVASSFSYQAGEFDTMRGVVGDDAAATVAVQHDSTFRQMGPVFSAAGDTSGAIADKYQQYLKFMSGVMEIQSHSSSQEETYQRLSALSSETYAKLTAGLSDAAKQQFDATQTGQFLRRSLKK